MLDDSSTPSLNEPVPLQKVGGRSRTWIKPGQVLNPHGNTAPLRSLAAHIRQETGYGRELVALLLAVSRGELIKMPGKRITRRKNGRMVSSSYIRPTLDQRIDAAARLLDRGWGKAKEIIELTGEASPAQRLELLRRLSDEDRAQLRGLLQRALEAKTTQPSEEPAANSIPPIITTASITEPQNEAPQHQEPCQEN
jgi:DNA-binding MarR family transcriptional regulator